mmetsp:Transcript_42041/g.116083  ORF Transcript_42041/g.116083 Transcript_42041/m.116083 type:complete len:666 (-) Transcript_42041:36-2033(-)
MISVVMPGSCERLEIGFGEFVAATLWASPRARGGAPGMDVGSHGIRGLGVKGHHVCLPNLRRHQVRVNRLLGWQRRLRTWPRQLLQQEVYEVVLVNAFALLEQLAKPGLGDLLIQRAVGAGRFHPEVFHVVFGEEGRVAGLVRQVGLSMCELVRDDAHFVLGVLFGPVEVQAGIGEVTAGDRRGALEEVVLPLPALDAARRRRAVRVRELSELAHEAAPINTAVVEVLSILPLKLRRPEELDSLVRDVVASRAEGVAELFLADQVSSLRVDFAEGLAELLAVCYEAIYEVLRDMPHVTLLRLMRGTAHTNPLAKNEVGELFETHRPLVVLVHSLDQHVALVIRDFDAHLVKYCLEVFGKDVALLREGAVPEHAHKPWPTGVALLHHLPNTLHPHDPVPVLRRRVKKVRQVYRSGLEIVSRLVFNRVDQMAARVILFGVSVDGVRRLPFFLRLRRHDVFGAANSAHEAVLTFDFTSDLLRLLGIPRFALLALQRGLQLLWGGEPLVRIPARRHLVPLRTRLPRLGIRSEHSIDPCRRCNRCQLFRRFLLLSSGRESLRLRFDAKRQVSIAGRQTEGGPSQLRGEVLVPLPRHGVGGDLHVRSVPHELRRGGTGVMVEVYRAGLLSGLPLGRAVGLSSLVRPLLAVSSALHHCITLCDGSEPADPKA